VHIVRQSLHVLLDAFYRFNRDDGWAIASRIALSILMSVFPFLIVVTAIAGSIGSVNLANEVARLLLEAWPDEVAGPLATEIHHALTTPHGGLVTIGGVFALYFSSSGIESLRIGLNSAYELREWRSFWVLRLESIGFVLLAIALVMLAFLIVLGPLLFKAAAAYVAALAPLESHDFARFGRQRCRGRGIAVHPTHVAAGRTARIWHSVAGHPGNDGAVADLQFHIRPLSRRVRLHVRELLRRTGVGNDRAGVSLLQRLDFRLWRRAQRRDRACVRRRRSSRHCEFWHRPFWSRCINCAGDSLGLGPIRTQLAILASGGVARGHG
jgi:hypothetical protein